MLQPRPPQYLVEITEHERELKPWLISTKEQLVKDEFDHDAFVCEWLQQLPFPGIDEDKLPWLRDLQEMYEREKSTNQQSKAPDAFLVATTELMRNAPHYIHLEIRAKKSSLQNVSTVHHEKFEQGLQELGRHDYAGEAVWSSYSTWLLEQPEDDQGLVTLGWIECHRTDETRQRITEFIEGLGLSKSFLMAFLVDSEAACKACPDWGIMKRVGENLYAPRGHQHVIPVRVAFRVRTQFDDQQDSFLDPLRLIKEHYRDNKYPKDFMCVARRRPLDHRTRNNSRRDKQNQSVLTRENTMVLWLPLDYEEERRRVFAHFCGEGEARHIVQTLCHGDGRAASQVIVKICRGNLKYLQSKRVKSTRAKFCIALALTMRASQSTHWMTVDKSSEHIKAVKEFLAGLAAFWRKLLTNKSDRQLGIGIKDEQHRDHPIVFSEGERSPEMSESRLALYRLLDIRSRAFRPYDFVWSPAVMSRKRKANALNVMQELKN